MSIRFLKISLASPESIRSWTERVLPNGKRVGKILKGDLIDYKNGLPIRDGLSCERIFGPMVSFTCTCGRFKCIETRGIHIVHDTLRSSRPILPDVSRQGTSFNVKQWGEPESSFQTSSNSTRLEQETQVQPIVSQNTISKPVQKLASNEKPSKRILKSAKPLESSILQPIAYRQKKMIRFLSDFYYDYKFSYHSNKNEIIPSFVSIYEEPSNISFVIKNFFKPQTVYYHSKKWDDSKSYNFFSPIISVFKNHNFKHGRVFGLGTQTKDANKQTLELKTRSFIVQNLLKPLYKFIFQIYTEFWFDLKVYYNNFIYEKHIFLWIPNRKFGASKIGHNFRVHSSFFSKLKIQGLDNKSQKLPIINGILPPQTACLNIRDLNALNHGCSNITSLPRFLVISSTPVWISNEHHVSKLQDPSYIESFFNGSSSSYLEPKNFFGFKLIQFNSNQIWRPFTLIRKYQLQRKNTFFSFGWLSMTTSCRIDKSQNKMCVYWSQRNERIELPSIFQSSMKLKLKRPKTEPSLSKYRQIIALYFAKQAKINREAVFLEHPYLKVLNTAASCVYNHKHKMLEKNLITSINQKFCLEIGLFKKQNVSTKNQRNKISLLMQEPVFLNNISYGKTANISFGSLKISSFDLKQGLSNPFEKLSSTFKSWNRNSQSTPSTLFQFNKTLSKSVSIFDSFKKQEKFKKVLLTSNHQSHSTIAYPFSSILGLENQTKDGSVFRDSKDIISNQEKPVSSLSSSWSKSPQIQETFSPKDKTDIFPVGLATPNYADDRSTPYLGSNTKQNIRVYKFKNFPPEEIRYCPYCEVELLPNSIRRYRLGYIEFVSPVTHIWYTANSIPLLLNLSKTIIEGIASCHEALSSGFPPVYKWSYNGESPTSWTFQMQPLKLPINSVPKLIPPGQYTVKKSYSTEIIFKSNSINGQVLKVSLQAKRWSGNKNYKQPFQIWIPSFRSIPRQLTILPSFRSKNNFAYYENRIKNRFIKNAKTNDKERTSKQKKEELLYNNNLWFLNYQAPPVVPLQSKRWGGTHRNGALEVSNFNNNSFFSPFESEETSKETLKKTTIGVDSSYLSWKDISYKFKCLWMFEYFDGKSLPQNSSFVPVSNEILSMVPNNFDKQENYNTFPAKQHTKAVSFRLYPMASHILSSREEWRPGVKGRRYLSYSSSIFNFPWKSFFDKKKINWFTFHKEKPFRHNLEITINNRQTTSSILSETMRGFPFFSPISKEPDSYYDLFTATEYEKKREWLKLEGFFEDTSNQKLPDGPGVNPEPEVGSHPIASPGMKRLEPDHKTQESEKNSLNQRDIKPWNETEKKNENGSASLDNLSLPLVLPFLGKNPDNIEFQNNYSNYEHFHIDPLKFIIDLFSTHHIWGYSSFNFNHHKPPNKFDRNQDRNLEVFIDKKPYNNIWNNTDIAKNNPIISLSGKYPPNILCTNQSFQKKNNFIKTPHSLKEVAWDFSLFSSFEHNEENGLWLSLNTFYMIGDNLFSKTYPFLASPFYHDKMEMLKKDMFLNPFKNTNAKDSTDPKNYLLPLQEWYPNQVQTGLRSNRSNFTVDHKNGKHCFRKLGRSTYYFKIEQMARLENAFLKNLFDRNKFHKTSVLKNDVLVIPSISPSIFYSINYSNKTMLKTNGSEITNQDFMIPKKTRFLFGFHLNVYGFNFLKTYLPKIQYPWFFLERKNRFFSSIIKYQFSSIGILNRLKHLRVNTLNGFKYGNFTRSIKIAISDPREKTEIFLKENLKNSLWPLKSNTKNSHKKLYLNNFNVSLHENVKNNRSLKQENSSFVKTPFNRVFNIFYVKNTDANYGFSPLFVVPGFWPGVTKSERNRNLDAYNLTSLKNKRSNQVGIPISIMYDLIIFGSTSLKNTPSASMFEKNSNMDALLFYHNKMEMLETKQLENQRQWPKTLEILYIEKCLKKWTQNQNFPAVYLNNLASFVKTPFNRVFNIVEVLDRGFDYGFSPLLNSSKSRINDRREKQQLRSKPSENSKDFRKIKQNFNTNKILSNTFFEVWPSLMQVVDYQPNQKISVSAEAKKAKQKLGFLTLRSFETTQIEFFGSLKIYAKRKFLKVWYHKSQKFKNKTPFLFKPMDSYTNLKDPKSKIKSASNQKSIYTDLINGVFSFIKMKKVNSCLWIPPYRNWKIQNNNSECLDLNKFRYKPLVSFAKTFFSKKRVHVLNIKNVKNTNAIQKKIDQLDWEKKITNPNSTKRTRAFYNKAIKSYIFYSSFDFLASVFLNPFKNTNVSVFKTPLNTNTSLAKLKKPKNSLNTGFLVCLALYPNKHKADYRFSPLLDSSKSGINENREKKSFRSKLSELAENRNGFFSADYRFSPLFDSSKSGINENREKKAFRSKLSKNNQDLNRLFSVIVLPWKKLQPSTKEEAFTKKKEQVFSRIIKSLSLNNSYYLNALRLSKLIIEPQVIDNLKHSTMKRHKNMVCYAYAIETIQNKKQVPYSVISSGSVKTIESNQTYSNHIQSLSSKISCFSYFGYGPMVLLDLSSKTIMQKKSTHQQKVIVQKIPKQIPSIEKRPVFYMKNSQGINPIQSKHDLQVKVVNPQAESLSFTQVERPEFSASFVKTPFNKRRVRVFDICDVKNTDADNRSRNVGSFSMNQQFLNDYREMLVSSLPKRQAFSALMEGPYTQIFKWGGRGHIFNRLSSSFYKTNNHHNHNHNHKVTYQFKNQKYNNSKNMKANDLGVLFRTDDSSSFANWTHENENQKRLSYYGSSIDEKQNDRTWKGNTNYYACISQITSWGSDHGSWILFLKYIRANIYKGDQLLPSYFNKMNFQMMPRTGSIMLQQLLSQLELVPKAFSQSLEPNFISKPKSVSKIDTWQNSAVPPNSKVGHSYTNTTKDYDTAISKPINKTDQNLIIRKVTSQSFHYHFSFLSNQVDYAFSPLFDRSKSGINHNREAPPFGSKPSKNAKDFNGGTSASFVKTLFNKRRVHDFNIKDIKITDVQGVAKINESLQARPTSLLSNYKSLINYKTFSILDGLVFLKKNLQKTISIKLNDTSSLLKKPTTFSNKYALYAYKIKKPVAHKRFRKIYQLNSCKPINRWYRLNNFFSYSQAQNKPSRSLASFVKTPFNRVFNIVDVLDRGFDYRSKNVGSDSVNRQWLNDRGKMLVSSSGSKRFTETLLSSREDKMCEAMGWDPTKSQAFSATINQEERKNRDCMIKERNIFNSNTDVAISSHKIRFDPKDKIHDFHLDGSIPCLIPVVGKDDRILKLIYSLIVSFQLQFLPVKGRAKESNSRSKDNKNLFNPLYQPTAKHLSFTVANRKASQFSVSNKAINRHPTYKISNTYYHIYSNQNNYLKDELWYPKSSIWGLSTKKNFIMSNGTGFDRYHHFLLQNSLWFHSYSLKLKDSYRLSGIKPWVEKNNHRNGFSVASSKKRFQAMPKRNPTNGVLKSYYNQNCSENFYFSNQKIKIYNVLISPLEVPTSRFLNFGFPTTPFDFIKSGPGCGSTPSEPMRRNPRSNGSSLKLSQNYKKSFRSVPLKTQVPPVVSFQAKPWGGTQKWSYVRSVNRLIGDIKPYHDIISNFHFNQKCDSKIGGFDKSQKKLTNNKYQNSLKTEFRSVLPINLETYEGQIKGETLFMKLREIGNYNVLIKKKDTLFKTLILKMNSSLRPLSSVNLGTKNASIKTSFDESISRFPFNLLNKQESLECLSSIAMDRQKLTESLSLSLINKKVSPLSPKNENWRSMKNRLSFLKRKSDLSSQEKGNNNLFSGSKGFTETLFSSREDKMCEAMECHPIDHQFLSYHCDAYDLTNTIANATEKSKEWNQDFIFEEKNMFPFYGQYFTFDKEQQEKKFQKNSQATNLEFFKVWLFLDTVHCSHLHWFNHLQNKHKVDSTLINKELALHRRRQIDKPFNQNSFPKILQFYKYRKNFLLKKIFKQRVGLTQYSNIWEPSNTSVWKSKQKCLFCLKSQTKNTLDPRLITNHKPIKDKQYQNRVFKIIPTLNWSLFFLDLNKFAYWRKNLIFGQLALACFVKTPFNRVFNILEVLDRGFNSRFRNFYQRWVLQNGNYEKKPFRSKPSKNAKDFNGLFNPFSVKTIPFNNKRVCNFNIFKNTNAMKYLVLLFSQKSKSFKVWFEAYTLLKRRINTFYDQERTLDIKYEFQPFGPQMKHSSSYTHWKNLKSFKPQIFDLRNTPVGYFKNQSRFRLLTIPQIFDLKDQSNSLNRIQKNDIPINILGPLFFSSPTKSYKKHLNFPVLKAPEKQSFWGTNTNINYDGKKSSNSNLGVENFYDPIFNSRKFGFNDNNMPKTNVNNGFTTVFDENDEHTSSYNQAFFQPHRPLSSETLFREENLKVSSSYKALLRKAKILEDYPVPDPDPIDSKSTYLTLLNGGLPRSIWFRETFEHPYLDFQTGPRRLFGLPNKGYFKSKINNLQAMVSDGKLPLLGTNQASWPRLKNTTKTHRPLSQLIWDGNQNRFKSFGSSENQLSSPFITHNKIKTNKDIFSMRDWTKLENETIANTNDNNKLSFFAENEQSDSKIDVSEQTLKSASFSNNQEISLTDQSLALIKKNTHRPPSFKLSSDLFTNSKYSRRSGTFNYGRNLRKLRLQYLRNFRRLRFIEYLKATYIKPEWMILSLLPVLPPDLRPVIANPRGYITGDINTHYQNVIYRNNNIEKLLDTFWIPRKFYSKISFSNHQKATALMLSSIKSYFHSVYNLPIYGKKPLKLKNPDSISEVFSKLTWFPLTFPYENDDRKNKATIKNNESLIRFREICSPTGKRKPINKSVRVLQNNVSKPSNNLFYKTQLADSRFSPLFDSSKSGINENRVDKPSRSKPLFDGFDRDGFFSAPFVWEAKQKPRPYLNSLNTDALKHNKNKGPFSFLINRLSFLNSIPFSETSQNNFGLDLYNEMDVNRAKLLDWKFERMISPMFSKFTTPYFDFNKLSVYALSPNKIVNCDNDQSFPRNQFLKPWALSKQVESFSKFEIQNTPKTENACFSPNKETSISPFSFIPLFDESKSGEKRESADFRFGNCETLVSQQAPFVYNYKQRVLGRSAFSAIIFNNKPWPQSFIQNKHSNFIDKTSDSFVSKKPAFLHLYESLPYNIHYKPLLKLYNHKSFFGSNIGIATGYNEIVQALRSKALDKLSTFESSAISLNVKDSPVPLLKAKIIRTQALHDSKPLQEMQYSLQKAVDALIDNSQKLQSNVLLRKGRPLKSLSDNLKGKEGRFRQHLLGKRVDYSGRSVIVVGPDLKLYECGIPLIMALRLFQPFLILYLIYRFKIASLLATQLIQRKHPMVINLLKKFIETWPILLNRAPTLHRMNIQAFKIRLVQGKAILLHPLVCSSYNADFDGDQMGVHVPITQQARAESWKLLWSINNSIAIASRQPLFLPSQDMVIGNYYLTAPPIDNSLSDFRFDRPHQKWGFQNENDDAYDLTKLRSNSSVSLIPKKQWLLNSNIQDKTQFLKPLNFAQESSYKNTTLFNQSNTFPPFSRQWSRGFQKMNHYFFSLEEAYQYYLNTAYRFHVNTSVWFRFGIVFETSEREKPIEITINKNGNSIYTAKYYEKQLKRNRILGKNAFYFNSHLDSLTTQHRSKRKSIKLQEFESYVQKLVVNAKFDSSNIDNIMVLASQTIFNRNLSPILLNQIIRSTFGRIEFYYEAFHTSRSEFINKSY